MGDMLGLIEKAKETMGEEDTDKFGEKIKRGTFDLQDFVEQFQRVRKMGPLGQLVGMLPGFNKIKAQLKVDEHRRQLLQPGGGNRDLDDALGARHPEKVDGKRGGGSPAAAALTSTR